MKPHSTPVVPPSHRGGCRARLLRGAGCLIAFITTVGLCGCVTYHRGKKTHRQSSTVDFLYPKGANMEVRPTIPHLRLPLDVGIAFVPECDSRGPLPEKQKTELLETVAERFRGQPFIRRIEVIPTAYLKKGGGFANLDQVRSMFGVDVVALVAYDQVQHTDEDLLALSYWTLVGAYLVRGEKNDTSTLLDTAVFHVPSRKLLFRAPGASHVKARSTYVNWSEELRKDSVAGLEQANGAMITNLSVALEGFQSRTKEKPEEVRITREPGYTGGGSLEGGFGLAGITLLAAAGYAGKRRGART